MSLSLPQRMRNSAVVVMRPLSEIGSARLRGIKVVLADIDDTITSEGSLTAAAYTALERLHRAGFIVMPVTGRPGRMVRSYRAHVASGRCRWRKRSVLLPLRSSRKEDAAAILGIGAKSAAAIATNST